MDHHVKRNIARIIFRAVPLAVRRAVFSAMAKLAYYVSLKHRLIALHNIARSFPEKSRDEVIRIAKSSYRLFALIAAEFSDIYYLNAETLADWVTIEGLDKYVAAKKKGKGVLLLSAHFGNWEMGNAALAITTGPIIFVYRVLDNAFAEEATRFVRASHGITSLPKENAMRPIIRELKKGETVVLLIDQNVAWYDGMFVDFFGRPAATTTGAALLAMHTGAAVLPAFTRRLENGKFVLEIGDEVELAATGNRDADALANTQRFTKIAEDNIRKYPDQWFWVHQRWKTKRCQAKPGRIDL
jgi:KDO2-lipid IV(A) lauroyltransferase